MKHFQVIAIMEVWKSGQLRTFIKANYCFNGSEICPLIVRFVKHLFICFIPNVLVTCCFGVVDSSLMSLLIVYNNFILLTIRAIEIYVD